MRVLLHARDTAVRERLLRVSCLAELQVDVTGDADETIRAFQESAQQLVLVAGGGGDSDLLKVCRSVRAHAGRRRCVLVMLPGVDDPLLHHQALQAGVDEVIGLDGDATVVEPLLERAARRAAGLAADCLPEGAAESVRRAVDRMQLGVTITDLDGTILYSNDADARMHGYQPGELVGRNVRILSPSDSRRPLDPDEASRMTSWRRRSVNLRKDGSQFPVHLLSDVVTDPEGRPVAVVTVCEDLGEREHLGAELGGSEDELTYQMRARTSELLEANIRLQHEILERRKAERQLLYEALHDNLTNLPNRALFYDRLARVVAAVGRHPDHLFAVLYLGLDRYRVVTESLGHEAGDRLLVQAAHRLRNSVRPEDTVGCAGGDEFLVLLEELRDVNDVTRVARRIQQSLAAPMEIQGQTVFTTASIGISLSATGYDKAEEMVRDAQVAMFRAQSELGGGHVIFDREMHDRAVARLRLEMQLRQALDTDQFTVDYQPIVALESGRVEGFEALARWRGSDGTPVPPAEFIPLAEETGTIFDLEHQILRHVCSDITQWRRLVGDPVPYVSVNLSGKELSNRSFADRVRTTLTEFDIKPQCLRFEVTESSIVNNARVASEVLANLKELGVRVYIDDFGTGYSSLSALHAYPIDTLKIDQSFVSGTAGKPGNWEIVRVIVGLAQNLGLDVIAEGIETSEQLSVVRSLGCHYGQGYLFSRPVGRTEVQRFLSSPTIIFSH